MAAGALSRSVSARFPGHAVGVGVPIGCVIVRGRFPA
jgi:hypothetical protein